MPDLNNTVISPVPPFEPSDGELWINSLTRERSFWNGLVWVSVGIFEGELPMPTVFPGLEVQEEGTTLPGLASGLNFVGNVTVENKPDSDIKEVTILEGQGVSISKDSVQIGDLTHDLNFTGNVQVLEGGNNEKIITIPDQGITVEHEREPSPDLARILNFVGEVEVTDEVGTGRKNIRILDQDFNQFNPTQENIFPSVDSILRQGRNITLTRNSVDDTITIAASEERQFVPSRQNLYSSVSSMFIQGSNITLTRNNVDDTITISASGGGAVAGEDAVARGLANQALDALPGKLNLTGGTMTGSLILQSDPTGTLEAATKSYVDGHSGTFPDTSTAFFVAKYDSAGNDSPGLIATDNINDNAVTTAKIIDGAIGTDKIANDSITSTKITDGAIDTDKIANNAIDNFKIADGAVGVDKLAPESVIGRSIADQTITFNKLNPNVITDIGNQIGTIDRPTPGDEGKVLTVTGPNSYGWSDIDVPASTQTINEMIANPTEDLRVYNADTLAPVIETRDDLDGDYIMVLGILSRLNLTTDANRLVDAAKIQFSVVNASNVRTAVHVEDWTLIQDDRVIRFNISDEEEQGAGGRIQRTDGRNVYRFVCTFLDSDDRPISEIIHHAPLWLEDEIIPPATGGGGTTITNPPFTPSQANIYPVVKQILIDGLNTATAENDARMEIGYNVAFPTRFSPTQENLFDAVKAIFIPGNNTTLTESDDNNTIAVDVPIDFNEPYLDPSYWLLTDAARTVIVHVDTRALTGATSAVVRLSGIVLGRFTPDGSRSAYALNVSATAAQNLNRRHDEGDSFPLEIQFTGNFNFLRGLVLGREADPDGGAELGNATPSNIASTASVGTASFASHEDHTHALNVVQGELAFTGTNLGIAAPYKTNKPTFSPDYWLIGNTARTFKLMVDPAALLIGTVANIRVTIPGTPSNVVKTISVSDTNVQVYDVAITSADVTNISVRVDATKTLPVTVDFLDSSNTVLTSQNIILAVYQTPPSLPQRVLSRTQYDAIATPTAGTIYFITP